jgi:hypothetical protein
MAFSNQAALLSTTQYKHEEGGALSGNRCCTLEGKKKIKKKKKISFIVIFGKQTRQTGEEKHLTLQRPVGYDQDHQ